MNLKKISIIALCFLIIDQAIKCGVNSILQYGDGVSIISGVFSITLLENTGAAFSILRTNTLFLILISILALAFIYLFFIKDKKLEEIDIWLYGMLIGGIFGNLIDRIIHGYVIDYLDFELFNFPVFNFADMLIVISMILIIIKVIKGDRNETSS